MPAPTKQEYETANSQHKAANARWEAVRNDREEQVLPFRILTIENALDYLENLRKIMEIGAQIINQRLGEDKTRMKCETCQKDLQDKITGRGERMPSYVAKKDFRNAASGIWTSLYFCSTDCESRWVRKHLGAAGTTGQ